MMKHDLVILKAYGKLGISVENKLLTNISIIIHLGDLKGAFDNKTLD